MKLNTSQLKAPRGLFKVVCLCLVIIDLVLARRGFAGGLADLQHFSDAKWVTVTSVSSYAFILPIIIGCYLLGDIVPTRMEMVFQLLGSVLFVTSGALVVERYQYLSGSDGDVGLALGSMLIITSLFMLLDFILLAKEHFGKK